MMQIIEEMQLTIARLRTENHILRRKLETIEKNHKAQIERLKAKIYDKEIDKDTQ